MKPTFRPFALLALLLPGCFWVDTTEVVAPDAGGQGDEGDGGALSASFASTILPALTRACGSCHSSSAMTAGLNLTSYAGVMAKTGVVIAGNASGSLIVQRIEAGTMPPSGAPGLTADELAALKQWISNGAENN